jgi:hypothetical protein
MTEMASELEGMESLFDRPAAFDSRPDIGNAVGIIERLARYLTGDPLTYQTATSANTTSPTVLPDEPRARSAVIQVISGSLFYRMDGSVPGAANEQSMAPGTIATLTGMASIKGFIFISTSATPCKISINYYD